ncbi:MAG: hypothetical protein GXO77_04700 [Calditrichaeota bacterium]|nr:hypothetical protein [Calditrichota bacterium]
MKTLYFLMLAILIFLFNRCSEDGPTSPAETEFKLNFINGYNAQQGWVILYSSDGKKVKKIKQFTGDAIVNFGKVEKSKGNFTIIFNRIIRGSLKFNYITSYISVPFGEWTFEGNDYGLKGKMSVDINYPVGEYDQCYLGTSDYYDSDALYDSSSSHSFSARDVYVLNPNQTMSLYSLIFSLARDTAYCGWLLNQPYDLGKENHYIIDASIPLPPLTITSDKQFDYILIQAFLDDNLKKRIRLFSDYFSEESPNQIKTFVANSFPAKKFLIHTEYNTDNYRYEYDKIANQVPNTINVPNSTIRADYNDILKQFTNISITGSADEIKAYWVYFTGSSFFIWRIYAPHTLQTLTRPTLPTEVTSKLQHFDGNAFGSPDISLIDFDTAENIEDVIQMINLSNKSYYQNHNERFEYMYRIRQ